MPPFCHRLSSALLYETGIDWLAHPCIVVRRVGFVCARDQSVLRHRRGDVLQRAAAWRQAALPCHIWGNDVSIEIESLTTLAGTFPENGLRLLKEWAALHRSELLVNWERARRGERLKRIKPLA